MNPSDEKAVKRYLDNCRRRGLRESSIQVYSTWLFKFAREVGLENRRGVVERMDGYFSQTTPPTARRIWRHLRRFFDWAIANGEAVDHLINSYSGERLKDLGHAPRSRSKPLTIPQRAKPYIDDYLADCELRNLSKRTRETYLFELARYYETTPWPGDKLALADYLRRYPNHRTKHKVFRTIKTAVRYWAEAEQCEDYVSRVKVRCAAAIPPPILTEAELGRIVEAIPPTRDGNRNRVFFWFVFYTGARRAAACNLQWRDVDLPGRWAKITTKGEKQQHLSLPPLLVNILEDWRAICPSERWVFPCTRKLDAPVDGHAVSHALNRYARLAGFERRVWVHGLRHAFATNLADAGISIDVISAALGHANLEISRVYVRMSAKRIRAASDQVFGGMRAVDDLFGSE